MTTPSYLGTAQSPAHAGGLLARLGSYFGGSGTPAYVVAGQPASVMSKASSDGTPTYAPAPVGEPEACEPRIACACTCTTIEEQEASTCPIDPEAIAAGQIAIVIPRQGS